MGVDDFRPPERVQTAGKLGPDPAQQCETQYVIGIILHLLVMIRIARSVIEMRGINQIDAHAVKVAEQQRHRPGECLPAGHHLRLLYTVADRRKPWQQHAGINPSAICAAGRAPVTSASPPVFNSGNISAPTCKTCMYAPYYSDTEMTRDRAILPLPPDTLFPQMGSYLKFSSISLVTRTMPSSER
jgi:hypothetical protein